jgi:hypothetical protein
MSAVERSAAFDPGRRLSADREPELACRPNGSAASGGKVAGGMTSGALRRAMRPASEGAARLPVPGPWPALLSGSACHSGTGASRRADDANGFANDDSGSLRATWTVQASGGRSADGCGWSWTSSILLRIGRVNLSGVSWLTVTALPNQLLAPVNESVF